MINGDNDDEAQMRLPMAPKTVETVEFQKQMTGEW